MRCAGVVGSVSVALLPTIMAAQTLLPPRTFDVAIDTNSAAAYYALGASRLRARPADAARAFYWATRLDPALAEALYGRAVAIALLLRDYGPSRAASGAGLVPVEDLRRVDSLRAQAYLRNPFVQIGAERALLPALIGDPAAFDPYFRGWFYLVVGAPDEAARSYAEAIVRQPTTSQIHADRARAFYQMAQYDSALHELTVLLDALRRHDDSALVHSYQSKATLEYMVGIVQAKRGDLAGARLALRRAITEDLAYHPARSLLAYIDLLEGDTLAAIDKFRSSVELRATDPVLRYNLGVTLLEHGDASGAEAQLRAAIELEPFYAIPRFYLGRALDVQGREAEALSRYREYRERAPRGDAAAAWAAKRLGIVERSADSEP